MRSTRMVLLVIVGLVSLVSAFAGADSELWERWTPHDPSSTVVVDHGPWHQILTDYLVLGGDYELNRFDYGLLKNNDMELLNTYLQMLQNTEVSKLNRHEQFAYWLNLYNAATVKLVADSYPVGSIRDIKRGNPFASGPWGDKFLTVEGESVSLDDIEHRILRPIWQDPRIHYGVNCASVGCPNLQPRAFTAENYDSLLDQGARQYVNSPRGARFSGNSLTISTIYSWFSSDFGQSDQEILEHMAQYAEPALARRLRNYDGGISHEYDWSLNGVQ